MAYSCTTSAAANPTPIPHSRIGPSKSIARDFFVTPESLTPGSPTQEPGLRYFSPTLHTWLSRDPLGELGNVLLRRTASGATARGMLVRARLQQLHIFLLTRANRLRARGAQDSASYLQTLSSWLNVHLQSGHTPQYVRRLWNASMMQLYRNRGHFAQAPETNQSSLFAFVFNNPLMYRDSYGMDPDDGSGSSDDDDGIIIYPPENFCGGLDEPYCPPEMFDIVVDPCSGCTSYVSTVSNCFATWCDGHWSRGGQCGNLQIPPGGGGGYCGKGGNAPTMLLGTILVCVPRFGLRRRKQQ